MLDQIEGVLGEIMFFGAGARNIETGVGAKFPAEAKFHHSKAFLESLREADDAEMVAQVMFGLIHDLAGARCFVVRARDDLCLHTIALRSADKIFEGPVPTPHLPVKWMQLVTPHEVEGRDHPIHGIAQDCDIGGWLRKRLM